MLSLSLLIVPLIVQAPTASLVREESMRGYAEARHKLKRLAQIPDNSANLAKQLTAEARIFRDMVGKRRPDPERIFFRAAFMSAALDTAARSQVAGTRRDTLREAGQSVRQIMILTQSLTPITSRTHERLTDLAETALRLVRFYEAP